MPEQHNISSQKIRVRVFVDYWNFQLNLRDIGSTTTGNHSKFGIDWKKLGPWSAKRACEVAGIESGAHSYDGMAVYSSFDPSTESGREFRKWATTWLNRQPGIDVKCLERKAKNPPKCPTCHRPVNQCPNTDCGKPMKGTIEKGVDTFIATDMIRLAWEEAYDLAVLATLDADLVPAVEFLNLKGRKVIHAGFPPGGIALATACWGSFDVAKNRHEFEFTKR